MAPEIFDIILFNISSVNPDFSFRGIIEPRDQIYKRRLARTSSSYDTDRLSFSRTESDIRKRLCACPL